MANSSGKIFRSGYQYSLSSTLRDAVHFGAQAYNELSSSGISRCAELYTESLSTLLTENERNNLKLLDPASVSEIKKALKESSPSSFENDKNRAWVLRHCIDGVLGREGKPRHKTPGLPRLQSGNLDFCAIYRSQYDYSLALTLQDAIRFGAPAYNERTDLGVARCADLYVETLAMFLEENGRHDERLLHHGSVGEIEKALEESAAISNNDKSRAWILRHCIDSIFEREVRLEANVTQNNKTRKNIRGMPRLESGSLVLSTIRERFEPQRKMAPPPRMLFDWETLDDQQKMSAPTHNSVGEYDNTANRQANGNKGRLFFLSHSGNDKAVALCVARLLRQHKHRFWLDVFHCVEKNEESIYSAIDQCDCFVAFASESYEHSKWCIKEMGYAEGSKKQIVCLRLQRPQTPAQGHDNLYLKRHPGTSSRDLGMDDQAPHVSVADEIFELFHKFIHTTLLDQEMEELQSWLREFDDGEGVRLWPYRRMKEFVGMSNTETNGDDDARPTDEESTWVTDSGVWQ